MDRTYILTVGQRIATHRRDTVEIVPRPAEGFDSILKDAIFIKFLDEEGQPIESRSSDFLLASCRIDPDWNPDVYRTCEECRGTGIKNKTRPDTIWRFTPCGSCLLGVPYRVLKGIKVRVA